MQALSDLQASLDAVCLELQDLREVLAPKDVAISDWVSSGRAEDTWDAISQQIADEDLREQIGGMRALGYAILVALGTAVLIALLATYFAAGGSL